MSQGAIIENLSGRKLSVLAALLFTLQIACFLIGAYKAPPPSSVIIQIGTKCIDKNVPKDENAWFLPRGKNVKVCDRVSDFNDPKIHKERINSNQIVFAYKMPFSKDNIDLDFTRWQQNLMGVLQPDIVYSSKTHVASNATLRLDMRLGYRNIGDKEDEWKLLAQASESRPLKCHAGHKKEGYAYHCELIPLFELGNVHHDFYLLNIRLPIQDGDYRNTHVGSIVDLTLVAIHQNGGFTKVWVAMKCCFLPVVLGVMFWFWRRVSLLERGSALIEQMLLALGFSITLLNAPFELISLAYDVPWMLLFTDIRQGVFYASLLSFWLVFVGEHLMDGVQRNRLAAYYKHLSAIVLGCVSLLIFDLCERGTQLKNPFYSIWVTRTGSNIAFAFIILAIISAGIYFLFLCFMIFKVYQNIKSKRSSLPTMSQLRRMHYEGVTYRFKFLMLATLLCAAMTVISYIVGQVSEGSWKWDMDKPDQDTHVEYNSAFFTGVYGMWNIYVLMLLALYAPSHKRWPDEDSRGQRGSEEIEFRPLPTEPSESASIAAYITKQSTD